MAVCADTGAAATFDAFAFLILPRNTNFACLASSSGVLVAAIDHSLGENNGAAGALTGEPLEVISVLQSRTEVHACCFSRASTRTLFNSVHASKTRVKKVVIPRH